MKYVFALLAMLGMNSAHAVIYDFEGVIDGGSILDPNGLTGIEIGSSFSGFFEYDPAPQLAVPNLENLFVFGARGYEFRVGTHTYASPDGKTVALTASGGMASFDDVRPISDDAAIFADDVRFLFTGVSGAPPSSLDRFDTATLFFAFFLRSPEGTRFDGGVNARGEITSFVRRAEVPEPGTWALLLVGLFGIFLSYRYPRRINLARLPGR